MNLTKSYHKGHPNPSFYRKHYTNLNGEWKFVFDMEEKGDELKYQERFPDNYLTIRVPYTYQSELSGIHRPDILCDTIWYEKEIAIDSIDKTYLLHFLAVDFETTVYVNGKKAAFHRGGYDAFTVKLDGYLRKGMNKITLKVVDKLYPDQMRGKQSWRKDNFTCFYQRISGIHESVYLEEVNKAYVEYFYLFGDYHKKELIFHVEVENFQKKQVCLKFAEQQYQFSLHKEVEDFTIPMEHPIAWSNDHPYLYDAVIELKQKDQIIDEIETYFGFKSIHCQNKHIYINHQDTYLKLVLNQGYYKKGLTTSNEEEIIQDLQLIKACGFNGFRMHQHNPEPLLFYYADIFGLFVWQEIPSAAYYSYNTYRDSFYEIPRQIKFHFNHPCIMAYTLFNESWGINEIKESEEIQKYTADMTDFIRPLAKDRLILSNDGWEHTKSDLLTIHHYGRTRKDLESDLNSAFFEKLFHKENPETIKNFKKAYAGDYRYHDEPILLDEFFGVALLKSKEGINWGYGDFVTDEKMYLDILKDQLDYIHAHDIYRGFCVTQLTDVQQEVNGIFTYDRKAKCDIHKIKEMLEMFK